MWIGAPRLTSFFSSPPLPCTPFLTRYISHLHTYNAQISKEVLSYPFPCHHPLQTEEHIVHVVNTFSTNSYFCDRGRETPLLVVSEPLRSIFRESTLFAANSLSLDAQADADLPFDLSYVW